MARRFFNLIPKRGDEPSLKAWLFFGWAGGIIILYTLLLLCRGEVVCIWWLAGSD